MLTSELNYDLPEELIAQHPAFPRDVSRLLIYQRHTGDIRHGRFADLLAYLNPGDTLAYNDSRVLKARVAAVKPTGGRVELLFLRCRGSGIWEALVKPSARLKEGGEIYLQGNTTASPSYCFRLRENLGSGRWLVENLSGSGTESLLERLGEAPLPPYIKESLADAERYQTVYARESGSAAAPTAGLHFTPELLERVKAHGVGLAPLTLHVGLDTFRPISEDEVGLHQIHREYYRLPAASYQSILNTKDRGKKVVAIGTTSVRVLESVFSRTDRPLEGYTDLFITPGFRFAAVNALVTNFHLPKSTLLALVMAFAGKSEVRQLYQLAIKEQYRFYSFGDAMLLL